MRRKKMLLITHGFPFGESERSFLSEEIKELEKQFDLTVMAVILPDQDARPIYKPSGKYRVVSCKLHRGKARSKTLSAFTDKAAVKEMLSVLPNIMRVKKVIGFINRSNAVLPAIERTVKEHGADIIYTYWCAEETYAALKIRQKHPAVKVISRLHGYDIFKERAPFGILPMHGLVADKADMLIFASRQGMDYFNKVFPGKAKRTVSYLGAKGFERLPEERGNSFTVISVSNVIPLKRVDRIAEAVKQITCAKLRWVHIGDGSELEAVKRAAAPACCEFTGAVPNDRIGEIFKRYSPDLFMTASSSEGGVPVSIAEAFSCGIPAVATAVGGIPEIVKDGSTGFLVSENAEPSELVKAIERYYSLDTKQQRQMRYNAYELYKGSFDAVKNAKAFTELLKDI